MTSFDDEVTAVAIAVRQGVHAGPSAAKEPNAIDGTVHVYDRAANRTISLDAGAGGTVTVGGGIYTAAAHVGVGGTAGSVHVYAADGKTRTISIDGQSGDIVLGNGDIAEEFDAASSGPPLRQGDLVVVTDTDTVGGSESACDPRVIGVVAGAGRYRPGLVLDHRPADVSSGRVAVSLVGKCVCRATADADPIRPGDFLVASAVRATATRAPGRALERGAVFGRSLGHLPAHTSGAVALLLGHCGA